MRGKERHLEGRTGTMRGRAADEKGQGAAPLHSTVGETLPMRIPKITQMISRIVVIAIVLKMSCSTFLQLFLSLCVCLVLETWLISQPLWMIGS